MSTICNDAVKAAIARMETTPELETYFQKTLDSRAGLGHPMGSYYPDKTADAVREALQTADWEPFNHPELMEGCQAFTAPLPGRLGIVDLKTLNPETQVTLMDPKGTGAVSAVVSAKGLVAPEAKHTVLIIGPDDAPGKKGMVVYTFHPGDPIRPSIVPTKNAGNGTVTTAKEAIRLGLDLAKLAL